MTTATLKTIPEASTTRDRLLMHAEFAELRETLDRLCASEAFAQMLAARGDHADAVLHATSHLRRSLRLLTDCQKNSRV